MVIKNSKVDSESIVKQITNSMIDKKAQQIISLDLRKIDNAVCDYFVICHGSSTIHVESIADAVEESLRVKLSEKPWHKEGYENSEWILLDYVNVVVHVFLEEKRTFYNLESLWADANETHFNS